MKFFNTNVLWAVLVLFSACKSSSSSSVSAPSTGEVRIEYGNMIPITSKTVDIQLYRSIPGDQMPVSGMHPSFNFNEGDLNEVLRVESKSLTWLGKGLKGVELLSGNLKGQYVFAEKDGNALFRVAEEVSGDKQQGAVFRFGNLGDLRVSKLENTSKGLRIFGVEGDLAKTYEYNYSDRSTFEMQSVQVYTNGFLITMTQPLMNWEILNPENFQIGQREIAASDEFDFSAISVQRVELDKTRKQIFIHTEGQKSDRWIYLRFYKPVVSDSDNSLWSTEAWYKLLNVSDEEFQLTKTVMSGDNILTEQEKSEGWNLLFDGESLEGWRSYNQSNLNAQWTVDEHSIHLSSAGGKDIVIPGGPYENFELRMDWKLIPGGNSGIIYNVVENEKYRASYLTGPEMQILDNGVHGDGKIFMHRAGDLYDMIPCSFVTANPGGEWNSIRLIINNGKVEHWQNGYKVVEYEMFTPEWDAMVAKSKFRNWSDFGKSHGGQIVLQDHQNQIWFKNIKIKTLK